MATHPSLSAGCPQATAPTPLPPPGTPVPVAGSVTALKPGGAQVVSPVRGAGGIGAVVGGVDVGDGAAQHDGAPLLVEAGVVDEVRGLDVALVVVARPRRPGTGC